jgi:hypothetical protein
MPDSKSYLRPGPRAGGSGGERRSRFAGGSGQTHRRPGLINIRWVIRGVEDWRDNATIGPTVCEEGDLENVEDAEKHGTFPQCAPTFLHISPAGRSAGSKDFRFRALTGRQRQVPSTSADDPKQTSFATDMKSASRQLAIDHLPVA